MEIKRFNVGIDLGTTNSVFCVYNEKYERPDVLKIYGKSGITPSVVYYDKESKKQNVAEVIIAKNRGGSTGTVELGWLGSYTKFVSLERRFDD